MNGFLSTGIKGETANVTRVNILGQKSRERKYNGTGARLLFKAIFMPNYFRKVGFRYANGELDTVVGSVDNTRKNMLVDGINTATLQEVGVEIEN